MADKNTGWACTHSASIIAEDNSGVTIRVICYWKNQGWRYDMNGVSAWVYCAGQEVCVKSSSAIDTTGDNQGAYEMGRHDFYIAKTTAGQNISCYAKITSASSYVSGTKSSESSNVWVAAKPSYTVSYNANGGSGAPGSQTKWYGTNLTLSSTRPSRTGHTFNGWATSASGNVAYQPGDTYTANAGVTLYAKWTAHTYTVSYDANGGSGAPGNQTKTYGVNLTLSSTKPTRTNYNFLGWSTSANGSVVYASGATYTNNSAVTLYAVWELAYVKPRIFNFTANRCTSDGTISETGTYIKVTFDWSTDHEVSSIWIDWSNDPNFSSYTNAQVTASGTSGSVSQVVGDGNISIETTYYARGYVYDGTGSTHSSIATIGTVKFPIDVKSGGTGVAVGKVAETEGLFDVGFKTKFTGGIEGAVHWKEYGYGDKFAITPEFNGTNDSNLLKVRASVGDAGTDPELYDIMTLSAMSGNMWIKGVLTASNLLIYRGWASDLNEIKKTYGIYEYTDTTLNRPSELYMAMWGCVINFYVPSGWYYQIAIGNFTVGSYNKLLAVRVYTHSGWTDWHYL